MYKMSNLSHWRFTKYINWILIIYRDLIIGNSELCGSSVETDSCAPKNTTECHVCEVDGVSYGVGDLVRAQNGGCIKW